MSLQFKISDVSAEFIMDVAKVISASSDPMSKKDVINCFDKSNVYVTNAISQCLELDLITEVNGRHIGSTIYGDNIKRSNRAQHFLVFRSALQKYPPFLLYVDFIIKGYSPIDVSKFVKGIMKIGGNEKIINKSLKNWGKYAELIFIDKNVVKIPEAESGLPSEYVKKLLLALQAELSSNIVIIETMGASSYAFLTKHKIGINDLTKSLQNYESDPKMSVNKSSQIFEYFISKFADNQGVDISRYNGISQLVDGLKSGDHILKNHMHISKGLGALRNMSHHDPDKETGAPWIFTPQGALISTLLVPTLIRSLHLSYSENKQEF